MAESADSIVDRVGRHLQEYFGGEPAASAGVTFVGLEETRVHCFVADTSGSGNGPEEADAGALLHFVSVGCSRNPMGDPTEILADPERGPRAEVLVSLRPVGGAPEGLHRSVAMLAAAPAVEGVILDSGAIMDLDEPVWAGSPFTAVLLSESRIPDMTLEPPRDPVRFLQAVPITATEAAWVRVRGADELRAAWSEAGIDPHDPMRRAASL